MYIVYYFNLHSWTLGLPQKNTVPWEKNSKKVNRIDYVGMEGATHYTTSILLRQLPSFHGPNSNVWTDNSAASNFFLIKPPFLSCIDFLLCQVRNVVYSLGKSGKNFTVFCFEDTSRVSISSPLPEPPEFQTGEWHQESCHENSDPSTLGTWTYKQI